MMKCLAIKRNNSNEKTDTNVSVFLRYFKNSMVRSTLVAALPKGSSL